MPRKRWERILCGWVKGRHVVHCLRCQNVLNQPERLWLRPRLKLGVQHLSPTRRPVPLAIGNQRGCFSCRWKKLVSDFLLPAESLPFGEVCWVSPRRCCHSGMKGYTFSINPQEGFHASGVRGLNQACHFSGDVIFLAPSAYGSVRRQKGSPPNIWKKGRQ